jgi:hypothetical protein
VDASFTFTGAILRADAGPRACERTLKCSCKGTLKRTYTLRDLGRGEGGVLRPSRPLLARQVQLPAGRTAPAHARIHTPKTKTHTLTHSLTRVLHARHTKTQTHARMQADRWGRGGGSRSAWFGRTPPPSPALRAGDGERSWGAGREGGAIPGLVMPDCFVPASKHASVHVGLRQGGRAWTACARACACVRACT